MPVTTHPVEDVYTYIRHYIGTPLKVKHPFSGRLIEYEPTDDTIASVHKNVLNGIAWLDEHQPTWLDALTQDLSPDVKQIRENFDIKNVDRCVLGFSYAQNAAQMSGYDFAIREHDLEPGSMGFAAYGSIGRGRLLAEDGADYSQEAEYTLLQHIWTFEIERRAGRAHVLYKEAS